MTNNQFIKLCLCSINYGRSISIETNKCEDGSTYYDVYAKHNYDDSDIHITSFGIYDFIMDFVEFVKNNNPQYDFILSKHTLKSILDDKTREVLIKQEIKHREDIEKFIEETKYITDWCKENNPCPNCKINKKDHLDNIHYNCELNHNNSCSILKEYHENRDKLYKEYRERKKEENKNA